MKKITDEDIRKIRLEWETKVSNEIADLKYKVKSLKEAVANGWDETAKKVNAMIDEINKYKK